jgi:hypothetical protein
MGAMKVILFGATGMVGQGALRECLLDPGVEAVLAVGRRATGQSHPKLREIVHRDFLDFSTIERELAGYDACLFALGVSSARMSEPDYVRVTYDFALAAARGRPPEQSGIDVRLRLRRQHRRHGEGTHHVGAGEGPDGERDPAHAVQGVLHVPARLHPALHGIVSGTGMLRGMYAVVGRCIRCGTRCSRTT